MKNFKKATTLILSMAICLSITACSDASAPSTENDPAETTTTTTTAQTTTAEEYIGDQGVEVLDGVTLKYLGGYDITKAGDIRPAYNYFKEKFNSEIVIDNCPDGEIMTKLATYISSDMSPDLVDRRDNTFPYFITRSMYEPLDNYIDLDDPVWASVKPFIEDYSVNGKHFYYPWVYVISGTFLIYNRAFFEEFGVADPVELYNAGNWTWNEFLKCMTDFVDNNTVVENPLGIYGTIGAGFINTTGKALVGYENGQLVNNMRSPEVERAQAFLENCRKEGLSKLSYEDYGNTNAEPVRYGYSAFHSMGDWKITDYSKLQQKDDTLDIMFVPFPRDPSADEYYYGFGNFGYLVPSGSKNIKLAAEFMTCVRMSLTDPELANTTKESIMKNKKYTDEQYDMWKFFQTAENFKPEQLVTEYARSLDATLVSDVVVPMLENTAFDQSAEQQSWTSYRETYFAMIDDNVNTLNEALKTY